MRAKPRECGVDVFQHPSVVRSYYSRLKSAEGTLLC